MSELFERHDLHAPYHLARGYLARDLSGQASSHKPTVLTLSVPMPGAALTKDVQVTFEPAVDPMHFDQPWHVHWTPLGGGPYPEFDGELTVRADEDYTSAILELRGTYRPPGGIAGAAFDRVAGGRVASATAQHLLKEIADDMEAKYRNEEAAKKGDAWRTSDSSKT